MANIKGASDAGNPEKGKEHGDKDLAHRQQEQTGKNLHQDVYGKQAEAVGKFVEKTEKQAEATVKGAYEGALKLGQDFTKAAAQGDIVGWAVKNGEQFGEHIAKVAEAGTPEQLKHVIGMVEEQAKVFTNHIETKMQSVALATAAVEKDFQPKGH